MIKKYSLFPVLLICVIGGLLLGAKSCNNRNKKTSSGSSNYNTFTINAPSNLTATPISYFQIDLSWTDNSNNEDGFEVYRSNNGLTYELLPTTNINFYSDTNVLPFRTYYYRVLSFTTIGDKSSYSNEITAVSVQPAWTAVSAGEYYSIAVANDGTVWSWGLNGNLQLGLGDTINRNTPTLITNDFNGAPFENIIMIATGQYHSISRKTNGTLWSWGSNGTGQLGTGDTLEAELPYPVIRTVVSGIDTDWDKVTAGFGATMAIKTNYTLWGWGYNGNWILGLGLGDAVDRTTPSQLVTDSDWSMTGIGMYHSVAIKTNRTLWSWGLNQNGQLGIGLVGTRYTPGQVGIESDWLICIAGNYYSIALRTNGTLWSWGCNDYGQLGLGDTGIDRHTPTSIGTESDWASIVAGGNYVNNSGGSTLAVKTTGTLWAWGRNKYGQLGLGNTTNKNKPTQVGSDADWSSVAIITHSLGIKRNGTLWTWGNNEYGQLGHNDTTNRNIPYQLGSPVGSIVLSINVISSSLIAVSWSDIFSNESGFRIERKTGTGGTWGEIGAVGPNVAFYNDITVLAGNIYYYRVRAYNDIGFGSYSNAVAPDLSTLSLMLNVISSAQIDLSWSDLSDDESGFEVARSTDGMNWTSLVTTTANTYSDTNVTPGNTYYYRVRSFNPFVNSEWSAPVNPSLAKPSASLLVINGSQIDLSWSDGSPDETGFRIERKTGTGGTWGEIGTVSANITTYSDTTVSAPTEYYYRIRAFNWFANSNWSNEVTPLLAKPNAGLLVINASQINLSWDDDSSDEVGFRIERRISPSGYSLLATVGSNVTSYEDTTVSPGNVYYYHVRAFNAFKNSDYSVDVTPSLVSPNLDNPTRAGGTFSQINLLWNDYNQDESGFQIERKTGAAGTWGAICTIGATPLTYADTTVTYSNTYYYKVKAFNPFIESTYSSEKQVINILPAPAFSTDALSVSGATMTLTWLDNSSNLETGFQIERATNISTNWSTTFTVGANVTTYLDTEVTPGNTYYYRVRAFNDYYYSAWSNIVYPNLSTPSNFYITIISNTQFSLFWLANNNPSMLSGFEIERKISGSDYSLLATVASDGYYYDTITSANTYYYRVRAFNAFVNSSWTAELTPTLNQPTLSSINVVSDNRIDLGWNDIWTDEEGVQVERSINNTSTWITIFTAEPNTTIYSDTPVTPGDIYYYRIRAFSGFIYSAYSDPPKTPSLYTPNILNIVTSSTTQIDLSWTDDNSDETGFRIERKNGKNGTFTEITTVLAGINTYSDITPSGFAPNTTYYYRMKAFNPFIESGYSEETLTPVWGDWSIVAGTDHTVTIKSDKTIWTWGWNVLGQLGLGDAINRNTPTQIGSQSDWSNVSAGWMHTVALKTTGVIWAWGTNSSGQLGLGDLSTRNTPAQMNSQSDWSILKAGCMYSLALKTTNTLWAWGANESGQLGLGGTVNRNTPTQIGTQSDWNSIAAGNNHTLTIKTNGYLWVWGKNDYGQLGLGDYTTRNTPTLIVGQTDWSIVTAGGDLSSGGFSIGLRTNGTIWAWGRNSKGQLGLYWDNNDRNTPTQTGTLSDWVSISAGAQHTLGRKSNGTIWAWGLNDKGQLGNNDYGTDRNTPVPVGVQTDWQLISAGYNHSIGIKSTGLLWIWGKNDNGQLGLGDSGAFTLRDIPTMVGE